MNRVYWTGVMIAGVVGGLIGYVVGMASIEQQIRKKYEESAASYRRAMEMAQKNPVGVEPPSESEQSLVGGPRTLEGIELDVTSTPIKVDPTENDYRKAIAATETDYDVFVDGGINEYGISYLEDEEYLEEDGRFKGQITIVMEEHNPTFFMDGIQIDDWAERLGDSIVVDFYKLVPPGAQPVLYVRNHRTNEDYEVLRESP